MVAEPGRSSASPSRRGPSRAESATTSPAPIDDPKPRELALVELDQYPPGILAVEAVPRLEGCSQETALLGHCSLLGIQQVALVGVKKEHASDRQENQQDVECEEAK